MLTSRSDQLYLIGVHEQAVSEGCAWITFFTTRGDLEAHSRVIHGAHQAVLLLGGSERERDFDPEFDRISRDLAERGVGSLRIDYRFPGDCAQCAIDALLACQYLDDEGVADVLLVGWSFGASVAMAAGSVARIVRGVAAISPVDVPDHCLRRMRRKSLLVMSGEDDAFASDECVRRLPAASDTHTRLLTYPDQRHDLSGARGQVRADLLDWISLSLDASEALRLGTAVRAVTG